MNIDAMPNKTGPRRVPIEQTYDYGNSTSIPGHEINEEGRVKLVSLRQTNKRSRSEVDDEDHSFSYGNQPKRFKGYQDGHGDQEKVPTRVLIFYSALSLLSYRSIMRIISLPKTKGLALAYRTPWALVVALGLNPVEPPLLTVIRILNKQAPPLILAPRSCLTLLTRTNRPANPLLRRALWRNSWGRIQTNT